MKDIGKKVNNMEKGNIFFQIILSDVASGMMANELNGMMRIR